jgi:hypothetical protein
MIPSGKLTVRVFENCQLEIVELSNKYGDFPSFLVMFTRGYFSPPDPSAATVLRGPTWTARDASVMRCEAGSRLRFLGSQKKYLGHGISWLASG